VFILTNNIPPIYARYTSIDTLSFGGHHDDLVSYRSFLFSFLLLSCFPSLPEFLDISFDANWEGLANC
jgi:hypothetical protein